MSLTWNPFLTSNCVATGDRATLLSFFQDSLGTPMVSREYGTPFGVSLGASFLAHRRRRPLWKPRTPRVQQPFWTERRLASRTVVHALNSSISELERRTQQFRKNFHFSSKIALCHFSFHSGTELFSQFIFHSHSRVLLASVRVLKALKKNPKFSFFLYFINIT